MRLSFCIFKVQGDGSQHFVEAALTFEAARTRVQELSEVWPGEYVIHNQATGERVSITAGGQPKN